MHSEQTLSFKNKIHNAILFAQKSNKQNRLKMGCN